MGNNVIPVMMASVLVPMVACGLLLFVFGRKVIKGENPDNSKLNITVLPKPILTNGVGSNTNSSVQTNEPETPEDTVRSRTVGVPSGSGNQTDTHAQDNSPDFTADDAVRILTEKGYLIVERLGRNTQGTTFKCRKTAGGEVIVVKFCYPRRMTEAAVYNGQDLEKINNVNNRLMQLQQSNVAGREYLTCPTLIDTFPSDDNSRDKKYVILESSLANGGNAWDYFFTFVKNAMQEHIDDPNWRFDADYDELKRVARDVLSGVKILHDNGLSGVTSSDLNFIGPADILVTEVTNEDGNTERTYSLSDFSNININSMNSSAKKTDLSKVGWLLFDLWGRVVRVDSCRCLHYSHLNSFLNGGYDSFYTVHRLKVDTDGKFEIGTFDERATEGKAAKFLAFTKELANGNYSTAEDALNAPYFADTH